MQWVLDCTLLYRKWWNVTKYIYSSTVFQRQQAQHERMSQLAGLRIAMSAFNLRWIHDFMWLSYFHFYQYHSVVIHENLFLYIYILKCIVINDKQMLNVKQKEYILYIKMHKRKINTSNSSNSSRLLHLTQPEKCRAVLILQCHIFRITEVKFLFCEFCEIISDRIIRQWYQSTIHLRSLKDNTCWMCCYLSDQQFVMKVLLKKTHRCCLLFITVHKKRERQQSQVSLDKVHFM